MADSGGGPGGATPSGSNLAPADVDNRRLTDGDVAAVSALHAQVFGPGRFVRTAYRVREGTPHVSPYCRGAFHNGRMIACVRNTVVAIGSTRPHLMLGPLAVAPDVQGQGFGKALVAETVAAARETGIGIVVLVGDMPYYGRFGFLPVPPGQILFPGPVNPARILAVETTPGALALARGLVHAVVSPS